MPPRSVRGLGACLVVAAIGLLVQPATAQIASPTGGAHPDQVHLSWVDDPSTTMAVTWRTASGASRPYLVEAWPVSGGDAPASPEAVTEPAPGGRGHLHKAQLRGLRPDAEYRYRVSGDGGVWSEEFSFRTAPSALPADGVVFTMNADVGTSYIYYDVEPILTRLASEPSPLHWIVGDLTYAGQAGGSEYEDYWLSHDLPRIARQRAVMIAWGNHDYDAAYDVSIETLAAHFQLPLNGQANSCTPAPYYALRYAGIHFVVLDDPDSPCFDRGAQERWLEEELRQASADPSVVWRVAVLHQPPFSSGCHGGQPLNRYAAFERYRVDLVLSGHDHNFERSWPVAGGGASVVRSYDRPPHPVYVVAGVGGSNTYDCASAQPWSAFHDPGRYVGYLRVTATQRAMTAEFVAKEAYTDSSAFSVVDRFTLTR